MGDDADIDVRAERARRCYTCNGWDPVSGVRTRETVGLVCPTCGWDYGSGGIPARPIPPGETAEWYDTHDAITGRVIPSGSTKETP